MNKSISESFVCNKYIIVLASVLTDYDRKLLTRLYQPLCGFGAIALYFTLWSELEIGNTTSEEISHKSLCEMMQCNIKEFELFKNRLEGLGLLKTYIKEGQMPIYIYELYAPLNTRDFFKHELLGTLIKQRLGDDDYKKIKSSFIKAKDNKNEYLNITHNFADVYNLDMNDISILKSVILEKDHLFCRENAKIESDFNLDIFLHILKDRKIKKNIVNNQLIELMNSMINLYNLNENELADILLVSFDKKSTVEQIDMNLFKKKCFEYKKMNIVNEKKDEKEVNKNGNVDKKTEMLDELEPFQFLRIKQGDKEPSLRDRTLIEDLSLITKLNPGVINVLIDYVMIKQNNTLPRPYVLKIASSLVDAKIKTTKEAMDYFYKIINSYTKPLPKTTTKPKSKPVATTIKTKKETKIVLSVEQEEAAEELKKLKKIRKERKQNEANKV